MAVIEEMATMITLVPIKEPPSSIRAAELLYERKFFRITPLVGGITLSDVWHHLFSRGALLAVTNRRTRRSVRAVWPSRVRPRRTRRRVGRGGRGCRAVAGGSRRRV